jgi:hypothetical protein
MPPFPLLSPTPLSPSPPPPLISYLHKQDVREVSVHRAEKAITMSIATSSGCLTLVTSQVWLCVCAGVRTGPSVYLVYRGDALAVDRPKTTW